MANKPSNWPAPSPPSSSNSSSEEGPTMWGLLLVCLTAPEHGQGRAPHEEAPSGSAASYVKPMHAHSPLAHHGIAHGGVCATESALIRSRLRGSSRKIFAKEDYRKTIGPDRAPSRIHRALRICKEGSFLRGFTVWWDSGYQRWKCNPLNILRDVYFSWGFERWRRISLATGQWREGLLFQLVKCLRPCYEN